MSSTIGFVGAGKMATALAQGLIAAKFTSAKFVLAADPDAASRDKFAEATGAKVTSSNTELLRKSAIVVLAVKPQQLAGLIPEIEAVRADKSAAQPLWISILAGKTLAQLTAICGERVIRVMPNTPCLVQQAASAYAGGSGVSAADLALVQRLLTTVGYAVCVPEKQLDAVTGLSGSGPAYVFQIIEALSDAGVRVGLPRATATQLAAQTLLGAAQMVLTTGEHPAALKDAVTSPGGTTIAGLHELERGGLRATLMNAVQAATRRSQELAAGLD